MPISYTLAPLSFSGHSATSFIQNFFSQGSPTVSRYTWSLQTIQEVILQVPHVSTKTVEDTYFFWEELMKSVGRGFSILISAANAIKLFGTCICIYHLASFTNKNLCNWLICYSMAPPLCGGSHLPLSLLYHHFTDIPPNPNGNASTDKASAPVAMHFGSCLSRLLQ